MAFAANSLLCRQALGRGLMDPAVFTLARILAGAASCSLASLAGQRPRREGSSARPDETRSGGAAPASSARAARGVDPGACPGRVRGRVLVGLHVAERGDGLAHRLRRRPGDDDRDGGRARRAARRARVGGAGIAMAGLVVLLFPDCGARSARRPRDGRRGRGLGRYSLSAGPRGRLSQLPRRASPRRADRPVRPLSGLLAGRPDPGA
jgi:hypothetical protein